MQWVIGAVVVLLVLAGVILLTGFLLPVKHCASVSRHLGVDSGRVWALINDFAAYPAWRSTIKSVEPLPEVDGRARWRERDARGEAIAYVTVETVPGQRLVRAIENRDLPYGGRWTYVLATTDGGCTLTITEDGEVYNPVFRFVSHFIIGHKTCIEDYLADVAAQLTPRPAQ